MSALLVLNSRVLPGLTEEIMSEQRSALALLQFTTVILPLGLHLNLLLALSLGSAEKHGDRYIYIDI